jgi:hypothetical protein
MADVNSRTEDWKSLPWTSIQRNVFHLQKRIYQAARQKVPMTKARIPKSHVRESSHAWFGSGGGSGDRPAHRNLGRLVGKCALT